MLKPILIRLMREHPASVIALAAVALWLMTHH